jgi:predicted nucleic acid-binding protein
MDSSNDPIGVPAPAMAEVLVGAGKGKAQYVSILSNTYRFQILPFDSRAAIEAAELIAEVKTNKQPWATWAKVKFDIQIVSIAKAEAASLIYADDIHIENLAKRLKIPVMRICDLPEPVIAPQEESQSLPSGQGLLQLKPQEDTTDTEGPANGSAQGQEDHKLEADPAHPAPIQGSDSGRAQGEAAGESGKTKT